MREVSAQTVYKAIKQLCFIANTKLPKSTYNKLFELYTNETNNSAKNVLRQILKNAELATKSERPLCQDTGFVTVFINIGQEVAIKDGILKNAINNGVADAYKEYFFRKSILYDPLFKRINTNTNAPVLIHTNIVTGDKLEIILSVKGGGCENVSRTKMLSPAEGLEGVKNFVIETVKDIGAKSCPPLKIGIGLGSNTEGSMILSKKALLDITPTTENYKKLATELLKEINETNIGAMGLGGNSTCFMVNILTAPCHIATLPVSISFSCHSSRYASATITGNEVMYTNSNYDIKTLEMQDSNITKIKTTEVENIRSLKSGENILLSGKIFTARDAAHKKFEECIKNNKDLPFDITNAIIFYAGPCPANENEVIGPIGPTTSTRMDLYTAQLYDMGLLATIGKGERTKEVADKIQKLNGKYFTVTGGVASLLQKCVISSNVIAYEELGTEAVNELEVKDLPVRVMY